MRVTLVVVATFVLATLCTAAAVFKDACDIHSASNDSSYVFKTPNPNTLLPPLAETGWLHPTLDEVQRHYDAAKAQCVEFQRTYSVHSPLPHPHPDMKTFGDRGQPLCRGTPQVFVLTGGIVVWPFGPIDDCPTYSKCWFGLLTCGEPNLPRLFKASQKKIVEYWRRVHGRPARQPGPAPLPANLVNHSPPASSIGNTTTTSSVSSSNNTSTSSNNYTSSVDGLRPGPPSPAPNPSTSTSTGTNADTNTSSEAITDATPTDVLPPMRWSIRALRVMMRVVGAELVVPEVNKPSPPPPCAPSLACHSHDTLTTTTTLTTTAHAPHPHPPTLLRERTHVRTSQQRLLRVASAPTTNTTDDVIIAQYTLTLPSPFTRVELRQDSLYVSALLAWDDRDRVAHGLDLQGQIYVGGTETRCRAFGGWTACQLPAYLEACDRQAFVTGVHRSGPLLALGPHFTHTSAFTPNFDRRDAEECDGDGWQREMQDAAR